MMTLDEARVLQKQREKRVLTKFLVIAMVIFVLFCLVFIYSDSYSPNAFFCIIPILILFFVAKHCGVDKFLTPKEFIGEVRDVHIYRITERVSKGVGVGHGGSGGTHFEAELLVKNKKGRIMMRTFWIGDVTSHLTEGDEIAILRFIDEPILISGKYWTSSR